MILGLEQNHKIQFRETFSTGIARKMLSPSDLQMKVMLDYMRMVEECSSTKDKQDKQDIQEEKEKLKTGDTFGIASIHQTKEFEWLTHNIEAFVLEYLEASKIEYDRLSLFHQKSWPIITKNGGRVNDHNHPNATLSAVFYLQTEPESGGELIFHNPAEPLIPGNIYDKSPELPSTHLYGLKPKPKLLVLFPSKLTHHVEKYRGEISRWSISYDISITANHSLGSGKTENMVVHPSLWREFRATKDVSTETAKKIFITQNQAIPVQDNIPKFSASDYEQFETDGFLVKERAIAPTVCQAVFGQILESWKQGVFDYIHRTNMRIHTPLKFSETTTWVMKAILKEYLPILNSFLPEHKMRYLAEFSSICVFPGAKPQKLHPDQHHQHRKLVTIFVNLLEVGEQCGPLIVVPHSHKLEKTPVKNREKQVINKPSQKMILPPGSSILMDSRLVHAGGENTTANSIRPVFYFSFGEIDIDGPTYSLLPEYRQKYTLDDFIDNTSLKTESLLAVK
ncbi:MAG: TIGR02466 family protein [Cyanobacteria bacterium P01_A01_bin.84]